MEFGVLGTVEVWVDARPAFAGHPRQRAVLAVLLLDLGRAVPLEVLIDRVWGEDPPPSVRNVVYGYVTRLRAVIADHQDPGITLSRRPGGYLLQATPDRVDLARFRRLVADAAAAGDDERAGALLGEAIGLWRGPALDGLDSPWLNDMRATLELERAGVAADLNDIRLRRGEHGALAGELAARAAESPADERLIGQLMLALYRCGRQADALHWFEQTRRHLADELAARPGPQLAALHQRILRADPALAAGPGPARGPAAAEAIAGPDGRARPVPRELPADVSAFTGRAAELAELDRLLAERAPGTGTAGAAGRARAAVISAVSGTAGVGKTALAVHWAHRAAAAGRFPDGQLHVNLRGYDPARPVTAADALAGFLRTLGVPGPDIPPGQDQRAARYRSLLAGKRMLIVLDNAGTAEQVRPLLPGTPGCAVLVTSRDALAGLVARDGATRLDLDLLPPGEATALLTELIGARAETDPDAVADLARQCARLPLALRVAAELAAARPAVPLTDLIADLAGQQQRLDLLDAADDPRTAVRAVFSWSYQQLTGEAARMFRFLGLHPGPDISVCAAASLAAVAEAEARRLLRELARAALTAEHIPGRYAFHDLLRAYAAEQTHADDNQDDGAAAVGRVLDHYLHTAARAALLLNPTKDPVALAPPRPGTAPGQPADHRQALAWFEAEHQVLLAAVSLAAESGFDAHAWQLPWAMASFLQARGHYQEWAATQRTALAAAARLGDTAAQAQSGRLLAMACTELGDHEQALGHYADSLTLYQRLGDRLGQAKVLQHLGGLAERQGRHADALGHAEQALHLYQAVGDKASEAEALNAVGWCHDLLGDYHQARAFCRQALALSAEIGHRWVEGAAWDSLGYAEHHLGHLAEAVGCYERALSLYREAGFRFAEADTLIHLGDTRHAAGEPAQAREAWQEALAILDDLRHPDAGQVRAKLASPTGSQPPREL
jgi:DNA-binding SARP family transcriptional activator/tetratricopeptide (TPR) repeat protein